jgi:hypothetical protein
MYTRPVVNCTFMPGAQAAKNAVFYSNEDDSPSNVVNSVLFTHTRLAADYVNCAFMSNRNMTDAYKGAGSFIVQVGSDPTAEESLAAAGMNADGTLKKGSALVDAGTNGLYFSSIGATDMSGGQRIYSRTIDMGACEYDWRGDFAAALRSPRRALAVTAASENVATNAAGGVALSGGDSLSVEWENSDGKVHDYSFVVEVSGGGTFAYSVAGGEPVEIVATGEPQIVEIKDVSGAFDVKFDFAGDGGAVVSQFKRSGYGLMLIFK